MTRSLLSYPTATLSFLRFALVALILFGSGSGARAQEAPSPTLQTNITSFASQSSDPIVPPNYEAYFADDAEAAARLERELGRPRPQVIPPEMLILVRKGLRGLDNRKAQEWVMRVGQGLASTRQTEPQDTTAIELIYHASAHPPLQYNSLYYGLSRVKDKTPAILHRMVEIAMTDRELFNSVEHVAWATADHKERTVFFLQPHLASNDPKTRSHAETLKRIFSGEITARDHWKLIATERALKEFGPEMGALMQRLASGDSAECADVLRTISLHQLSLIMEDAWMNACRAASSDPDAKVRKNVAFLVSARWATPGAKGEVDPRALELLLQMSRDEDREVRRTAREQGLRRFVKSAAAQERVREMEADDLEQELAKFLHHATNAIAQRRFNDVESLLHNIRPGMKSADPTASKVTAFVNEIEAQMAAARRPQGDLQKRLDAAAVGAIIEIPEGEHAGPILIEKALTLRGAGTNKTTLRYQGDEPAVMIRGAKNVRIENLSVRWATASTDAKIEHPAAVAVRDASVILDSVDLEPIDRPTQTPYGLMSAGRAEVQFINGRSRGFAFALIWQDGANGKVIGSDLRGAGHSVVTVHPESHVEIAGNVLADCGYHAVRITGGTVDMHDNIVMNCKKAGAYLGNRDAHGRIYNNLFTGNFGEIWGYSGSDVVLEHNVFYRSKDPALAFWNTCALIARANSFIENPTPARQYVRDKELVKNGLRLEGNHYWENKLAIESSHGVGENGKEEKDDRFQLVDSQPITGDPMFRNAEVGDFTPLEGSILMRNGKAAAGLLNPGLIQTLAERHKLRFEE